MGAQQPQPQPLLAEGAVPKGWGAGMDLGQWMEAQCWAQSRKWRLGVVGSRGGEGRARASGGLPAGQRIDEHMCLPDRMPSEVKRRPLCCPSRTLIPCSYYPPQLPPSPSLRAPDLLGWSAYDVFLSNYLAHFPPRQLLVLYASQLATQPAAAVAQLEAFLGAPPGNYSRLGAAAVRLTPAVMERVSECNVRAGGRGGAGMGG